MTPPPRCWVLSDGKPGMENQCLGLAEALGIEPTIKRIAPRFPYSILPPQLWLAPLLAPGPAGDPLSEPWPELLISSGRQAVAPAIAIKRANRDATFTVQIQNPGVDPGRFDLVAVPAHDRLSGDNVIATFGALHRVTPGRLVREAARFRDRLAGLPRPLVAVLVGGTNRQYRMSQACAERLARGLVRLGADSGAGFAVTTSRRTGTANEATLREHLAPVPSVIWDGAGENPYFGYLALADAIVVTGDSVSMVSEACATGKPVYVFDLEGGSKKFDRFHDKLRDRGITRRCDGTLAEGQYQPPDDTSRVADEVRRRFGHAGLRQTDATPGPKGPSGPN